MAINRSLVIAFQSIALLVVLAFLSWTAFSNGLANLFTASAAQTGSIDEINAALRLNPNDPQAHYTRSGILVSEDPSAANAETTQAAALRPRDYVFWLGLAQTRELDGDLSGAIDAASQASRLAPFYAQPRWRLGNLLIRAGRRDEGFRELRLAAASDAALLPSIIDLAWQLSHGNSEYVEQVIQPNTTDERIALADFFRRHHNFTAAVRVINDAGQSGDQFRRQFLSELIAAKNFDDAHRLWLAVHQNTFSQNRIFDAGFEEGSDFTEPGFGWRTVELPRVAAAIDHERAAEGKASLKITFNGDSEPGVASISQIVMVEPNTRYALTFAGHGEQIISGGLPTFRVIDAVSGAVLGESVLKAKTDGWLDYMIDFQMPANSSVIEIRLQRQSCSTNPCPIFGTIWLDKFSLQKK